MEFASLGTPVYFLPRERPLSLVCLFNSSRNIIISSTRDPSQLIIRAYQIYSCVSNWILIYVSNFLSNLLYCSVTKPLNFGNLDELKTKTLFINFPTANQPDRQEQNKASEYLHYCQPCSGSVSMVVSNTWFGNTLAPLIIRVIVKFCSVFSLF